MLTALRDHLAEVKADAEEKTRRAEEATRAAEKAAAEAKQKYQTAALALPPPGGVVSPGQENIGGMVAVVQVAPAATPTLSDVGVAAASGRAAGALLSIQHPDAAAASLRRENLSMTELYTKYAEAADAWRKECAERRRLQATIDGMIAELEQRAPLLAEQRAEYERAVNAHAEMRVRLEESTVELRRLETEQRSIATEKRHHARVVKGLEAQSADLSRQVSLLLAEVQELKGGGGGGGAVGSAAIAAAASELRGDSGAVITSTLVDFRDISELQEQNRRQLEVIRQLSADQEESKCASRRSTSGRLKKSRRTAKSKSRI